MVTQGRITKGILAGDRKMHRVVTTGTVTEGIVVGYRYDGKDASHGKRVSMGWSKLFMFDGHHRLCAGRYRLQMRDPPFLLETSSTDMQMVPRAGHTEVRPPRGVGRMVTKGMVTTAWGLQNGFSFSARNHDQGCVLGASQHAYVPGAGCKPRVESRIFNTKV